MRVGSSEGLGVSGASEDELRIVWVTNDAGSRGTQIPKDGTFREVGEESATYVLARVKARSEAAVTWS